MNGRVYDPWLGRFLSPDNYVQQPWNSQSFNRYSYCFNNPLKFIDPSGYSSRLETLMDWYDYEGGGFWYRGSYYGYNSDNQAFINGQGQVLNSGGYHFDWIDGTYKNGYGRTVSWNEVDYAFVSNVSTRLIDATIISNNWAETNPLFRGFHFSDGSEWYTNDGELPEDFWDVLLNTAQSRGNEPLPSWSSWINNGLATVAYGGTVTGGSAGMLNSGAIRYYANAWKGNQYIKTFNLTKLGSNVGYGTSFVGFGIGLYNFFDTENKTWGTYGQLGISLLSSGLTLCGYTAPIGIGIGFIDVAGGFNDFYNDLDSQHQFYNSTGGVILLVNGIPSFIPLRKP
jgi:hypothetical protein